MPEYAEVKIAGELASSYFENYGDIYSIEAVNPNSKVESDFSRIDFPCTATSESRGKELQLKFYDTKATHVLTIGLGMSGHWQDIYNSEDLPKHTRLVIKFKEHSLCLVDQRRFARWKWGSWGKKRGPDPVEEYEQFKENVLLNLDRKAFDKPIYEVLLNQQWFNGVGNYLRSTILYHLDKNPFQSGREFIQTTPIFFRMVRDCCEFSYTVQSGQLGLNYREALSVLEDWMWYQTGESIKDKNGRTFWFDPKWKNDYEKFI